MRFTIIIIFFSLAFTAAGQVLTVSADSVPEPQSVGLVLSGGGAKGIAHIGVIKALEDNDIPIDYITGTSMGAIVGSLYACGFTPEEMLALIGSEAFTHWSTGTIDKKLTYYFLQDDPLPTIISLNLGDSDSTLWKSLLPSSLINPLPMNFAFMELYAPYTAQCGGDFDRLFVPLRTVCSDMTNKRMVVRSSGSLGDAVRASMSFPLVFHPVRRDGALLYDGGIYDNFPVDVMRENFAPQIMIGVDVSATETPVETQNMVAQLETLIMQHNDYRMPSDQGIKLRVHLEQFGLLDFDKARQIYQIGYDRAMSMMDSIKCRVHSREPAEARDLRRRVFKSQTPGLCFDSVAVAGGTPSQNAYVKSLFTRNRQDTFGIDRARNGFYRAITPGKFKNLEPIAIYDDTARMFTLSLQSTLKDNIVFGIGGYLTTSANSMLFLTGGYKTLNYNSLDLRLNGWIGQSYLAAEVSAHMRLLRAVPSSLQLKIVATRQKYFSTDKIFFQRSEPTTVVESEYFGRISYGVALGRRGKGDISLGYGHTENRYFVYEGTYGNGRNLLRQNLAQGRAAYEYNTLNSFYVPTDGSLFRATVSGVLGQAYVSSPEMTDGERWRHHRSWLQGEIIVRNYWNLSRRFALGVEADLLYSTRKLLPTFAAAVTDAPGFTPSASCANLFSPDFRANSFGVVGVVPVWKLNSVMQLRGTADLFVPLRPIKAAPEGTAFYGDYLSRVSFFGQLEAVATFSFANVSVYTHYTGVDGGRWNFGLAFGFFLQAPRFLR